MANCYAKFSQDDRQFEIGQRKWILGIVILVFFSLGILGLASCVVYCDGASKSVHEPPQLYEFFLPRKEVVVSSAIGPVVLAAFECHSIGNLLSNFFQASDKLCLAASCTISYYSSFTHFIQQFSKLFHFRALT